MDGYSFGLRIAGTLFAHRVLIFPGVVQHAGAVSVGGAPEGAGHLLE